jgi:hypothetical protein
VLQRFSPDGTVPVICRSGQSRHSSPSKEGLKMNRIDTMTGPAAVRRHPIASLLLAAVTLMGAVPAGASNDSAQTNLEQWLLRRLIEPTERERAHEREGNVYIYDGLADREVDQAMNLHFDRIEYMMFVGTRRTEPTEDASGDAETESPGCGS